MEITALLIVGSMLAMAAAVVVTARPGTAPALASQGTAVGLGDPAADTLADAPRGPVRTDCRACWASSRKAGAVT